MTRRDLTGFVTELEDASHEPIQRSPEHFKKCLREISFEMPRVEQARNGISFPRVLIVQSKMSMSSFDDRSDSISSPQPLTSVLMSGSYRNCRG
jgi:hypothetical protein